MRVELTRRARRLDCACTVRSGRLTAAAHKLRA
jgi:hypothetical protein